MSRSRPTLVLVALAGCSAAPAANSSRDGGPDVGAAIEDARRMDSAAPGDRFQSGSDATSTPAPDGAATPDGGVTFAGCPGPEVYAGDPAWKDTLAIATPGVKLCARWAESDGSLDPNSTVNSLKDSLAAKGLVIVAPGRYALPDVDGQQGAISLPICLVRTQSQGTPVVKGTVRRGMYGPGHTYELTLPVTGMGLLRTTLLREGQRPITVTNVEVDGFQWCHKDAACLPPAFTFFWECTLAGPLTRHRVTLEGGSVELEVVIYRAGIGAGTEPAVFQRASGSFRGVTFNQREYFKLIYSPEHHHFNRNFAVLFDAPVEGACGLEIVNVPSSPMMRRPLRVWTVDCKLTRLAEVKVLSATQ